MKNIQKIVVVILVSFLTSCVVPTQRSYARQGYRPQQGRQVKHLKSVTVTKRQTGHCEARIIAGPDNIPSNQQRVAEYASQVYMRTGRIPSESELTQHFSFRAQARWVDTPDKVVKSITVQPSELPDNIRRRFQ